MKWWIEHGLNIMLSDKIYPKIGHYLCFSEYNMGKDCQHCV